MSQTAAQPFLTDVKTLRERARKELEQGAITPAYQGDVKQTIEILQSVLATEIVCVLRYKRHYFMAQGIASEAVKEEFAEHADEEQEHADRIAERIVQLGGEPDLNPDTLMSRSHSEYKPGTSLVDMLREDLIAERIAIESYREMIRYFGERDPTSRVMMEEILAKEEEHADELTDLLFAVEPATGQGARPLYFADEVGGAKDAGDGHREGSPNRGGGGAGSKKPS
jgi:bacterioferritin